MIFNRGNPLDYDGWAQNGLSDWSWSDCLPYFKKMETFSEGGSEWRGDQGPLQVSRCKADFPLYHQFLRAGEQAGFPLASDHNARNQEGLHIAQAHIHGGVRWSASRAYLKPAERRPNLQIRSRATVLKVLFEGQRAIGVVLRQGSARAVHGRGIAISTAIGSLLGQRLLGMNVADMALKPTHEELRIPRVSPPWRGLGNAILRNARSNRRPILGMTAIRCSS
ncbi:GMC family oxidoreductase N-terminal domain-containing protein [Variovorax sp. LjRoot84]|uniref:GMC family oxidoreductase N-terminal domain-containing protein n=1 Tax=unclassified Variovorax TaxID=663243 RepID=UPI003ECCAECD